MLTAPEFSRLLGVFGETVEVHQTKAPKKTYNIKAIVQSTSKAHEQIVQAYGVNGMSFQFAAVDHVPDRLDTIVLSGGEKYTIDSVVKHFERGTGKLASTTCYCKGR